MEKHKYDTEKYPFRKIIQSIYNEPLENLNEDLDVVNEHTDQDSDFHKMYYNFIENTKFYETYKNFIKEVIYPIFNEEILYQAIPTIRFHLPGNLGVGAFHRDSEYSHSTHEKNIFLPVTKAFGNNTIWAESEYNKKDYSPMDTNYGEFYLWDGANLLHGNKLNDTNSTRVSFDFRILPRSKYNENNIKESITNNTKMVIGEYWSELC
tara:strand:- start:168 stop:791 length:624 start_codon:yes stop_codon:yes gene_type:complete